ncbi:hypothetical protein FACS189434_07630 [Bacteroidia bacterium]|nr:hypothetical protein FACS189434_07630 [Bacteroidia bacterium]
MKNILKLSVLFFAITLFSCGSKYATEDCSVEMVTFDIEEQPYSSDNISSEKVDIERKIIKEGSIRFETTNAAKTKALIANNVSKFNGYISKEETSDYEDRIRYDLTIRIPAKYFDTLLDSISRSAQKIDNKEISAKDVTAEFIDIEARLSTKKELENRYKELLKRANKVEEILSIEKEIGTLRSDIESIEGRYKYLKDRVAFSTLDITYYEKGESSFAFGSKFVEAIKAGWTIFLWFLIGITTYWSLILLSVIVIFVIIKIRKRRKRKK